jgi:hypothetical protein
MPSKEKDQNESPSHLNVPTLDKTYKYFCILFLPIEKAASGCFCLISLSFVSLAYKPNY